MATLINHTKASLLTPTSTRKIVNSNAVSVASNKTLTDNQIKRNINQSYDCRNTNDIINDK